MDDLVSRGTALMGLPHIGAEYLPGWSKRKRRYGTVSDVCEVCHRARANSTHHIVPIGAGGHQSRAVIVVNVTFCDAYDAEFGGSPSCCDPFFEVFTPMIAVCGDGATGCHGRFEDRLLTVEWAWNDRLCKRLWFSGWALSHGYAPYDPALYELGHYRIVGRAGEIVREVRR